MADDGDKLGLVDIGRERLNEAAEMLALAFASDPMVGHLFPAQDGDLHSKLQSLFRFSCEVRLQLDWPLKGCEWRRKLFGVMGVTEPDPKEWPASLIEVYRSTSVIMGPDAMERMEHLSSIVDASRPPEPHYFLGVIGTHPAARGMGCARLLMDCIHALSESHPDSIGVALDTENPNNVAFYNHFGYHVLSEHNVDGIKLWVMFRPNGAANS